MIVTIDEVKNFLKIDFTDDDTLLTTFIAGAELYLSNATGTVYDSTNPLAKLYCFCLIEDWYENRNFSTDIRTLTVNEKVKFTLQSIILQLSYGAGV